MDYWPLGGWRRGFTPRALVSSLITHRCVVLMFASLFPLSLPFNYCYGCDYLWFRLFINSVLAYVYVPHVYCLIISLNWYFVNWGLNIQGCFTHILNIQLVSERVHLLWFNYFSAILDHFWDGSVSIFKCTTIFWW